MELGVNLRYFSRDIGLERAAEIAKEAGFSNIDYTPLTTEANSEISNTIKIFEKNGLSVIQTHAPFNRYGAFSTVEDHKKAVDICLENTKKLNAEYMVVHGDEFDFNREAYSSEKALEYNYDYFAPIVSKAEKLNIKIAFENVFEDIVKKQRYCSKAEELIALIERFNAPNVCACWDFGHGALAASASKEEHADNIIKLKKYIECTHVHDNYLKDDLHLIPFMGKIDWRPCINALKTTNCNTFTYELVYGKVQKRTAPLLMKLLWETGKELVEY